jgi:hypothetical protein
MHHEETHHRPAQTEAPNEQRALPGALTDRELEAIAAGGKIFIGDYYGFGGGFLLLRVVPGLYIF